MCRDQRTIHVSSPSNQLMYKKPTPRPRPKPKRKPELGSSVANVMPPMPKKPRQPRFPKTENLPPATMECPDVALSSVSTAVTSPPVSTVVSSTSPARFTGGDLNASPMTYEDKCHLHEEITKLPGNETALCLTDCLQVHCISAHLSFVYLSL